MARPGPLPGHDAVDSLTESTCRGRTVLSAAPPGYDRYTTLVIPDGDAAKSPTDAAPVEVLQAHTAEQPWWLGYLDTGVADVVNTGATRVAVYVRWPNVLLEGAPERALTARRSSDVTPWHSAPPELLCSRDRPWLLATPWGDDWRRVGGPGALVEALLLRPELEARAVVPDDDMTPPGHASG